MRKALRLVASKATGTESEDKAGNPNSRPGCNAGRPVLADHYGEFPDVRFG